MVIKEASVGQVDLSGTMTKQEQKKKDLGAGHIANMGGMLEEMELRIRMPSRTLHAEWTICVAAGNAIEGIYIQKTREVVSGMRSATGQRDATWSSIADSLKVSFTQC